MASWRSGALRSRTRDDAARACRAALACEAELEALQQRWQQRGLARSGFRIGLHTGEMVVGEVGSAERGKYAVVGDAMNLASRIEGANKHYGTRSLASEATRERAGGAVECREIDTVRVIGRRQPVRIFELLARAGSSRRSARRRASTTPRASPPIARATGTPPSAASRRHSTAIPRTRPRASSSRAWRSCAPRRRRRAGTASSSSRRNDARGRRGWSRG